MNKLLPALCTLAVVITACDKKEILPGKRESIDGITELKSLETAENAMGRSVIVTGSETLHEHTDIAGNKQHNSPNHKMNREPHVIWEYSLGGHGVDVPPIILGEDVYAINSRGDLICLSLKDGKKKWETKVAKQPEEGLFAGGMTAHENIIYIATNTGDIVAVDTRKEIIIWRKALNFQFRSAPLYAFGKLIVTSIDGKTVAIDATDGNVIWKKSNEKEITMIAGSATPVLYGQNVICAYNDGDVKSYDIGNGTENWSDTLFAMNNSDSGAVVNNIVASPVVNKEHVLVTTSESNIVMFDATTGIRLWEKEIGTVRVPIINSGWVFVLTQSEQVMCLSENEGKLKWSANVRDLLNEKYKDNVEFTGILLINGDVAVFTDLGHILTLDVSTGKLKKQEKIDGMTSITQPIIVDSKLITVTSRAKVYAIG